MLELPEAVIMAQQISNTLKGKRIINVNANGSPHKFAWFHGDPQGYQDLLKDKAIESAVSYGGMVEIATGEARIVFGQPCHACGTLIKKEAYMGGSIYICTGCQSN